MLVLDHIVINILNLTLNEVKDHFVIDFPKDRAPLQNTHPSHAMIARYTEELNQLPYRQKFPKLEQKNVQFWLLQETVDTDGREFSSLSILGIILCKVFSQMLGSKHA